MLKFSDQGGFNLDQMLTTSPTFTMILYSYPIRPEDLEHLQNYAKTHKTPLMAVHSAGFYSYFRIHLPGTFPIVDTHPDETATTDLRLVAPWPELSEFAVKMTADIDNLDNHEHGHLPYVVILLHFLDRWRQTHDGKYPSTYKEKVSFRKTVEAGARRNTPEGGEENFDEAVAAVLKNIAQPSLPSGLKEIFDHQLTHRVCA
jgi:NEDD8-activating enzyme E1 regulatory subunit